MKIVFDLDGTLCDTRKKEDGGWNYSGSKPYLNRIEVVNNLYDEGNHIIIDTARGSWSKKDWSEVTAEQLKSWGVKYHELRVGEKLAADLFVDDRAVNSEQYFRDTREL